MFKSKFIKKNLIFIIIFLFMLDFCCYKFYGFGLINGNLFTINFNFDFSLGSSNMLK
jgi:hypothetical protein